MLHEFVTKSHPWGSDDTETVEILSDEDVDCIAENAAARAIDRFRMEVNAKTGRVAHRAENAMRTAEDARKMAENAQKAAARAEAAVQATAARLVEEARETFRGVIEELLLPYCRQLAQQIDTGTAEGPAAAEPKTTAAPKQKATRKKTTTETKKKTPAATKKKPAASRKAKPKEAKPSRKR